MLEKIGRKLYSVWAFDVESHNDDETIAKGETSIWLASFINDESKMEDESCYFYDIPSWLKKLEELTFVRFHKRKRVGGPLLIYIYNLSFEWSFIFPYLERMGFAYKENIEKRDEYVYNSVCNKSCASVWEATFKFGKRNEIVKLRDLCKILPGGLGKVAKSFGLETQKGIIDYRLNRLHGYEVTQEEKEYCFKDTRILVEILLKMQERGDKDFWKSCSAASYASRKMIATGFPRAYKPLKAFRKYYPELGNEESEFLRHGVGGGITYATPSYQFRDIRQTIAHIDLHQAHPSSAYYHRFPYGKGRYFKGEPPVSTECCCCHVKISYSGVLLHSVIKLIGIDVVTDYDLTVWDFEIPLMQQCYLDLQIRYIDGYAYRKKWLPWRDFYKKNYEARAKAKEEKDAFHTMYYKLLNNSSYGKLLEEGHNLSFRNVIREDGVIDSEVMEKPIEKRNVNATYTYLPVGSCIPAFTRRTLVSAAMRISTWKDGDGVERYHPVVVYFDTDSIFYISNEHTEANAKKLDLRDHLGGWGREPDIERGQFSAPKRYKIQEIRDDGTTEDVFHMAGVNFGDDMPSYDDLDIISGHYSIQGVKRVRGGTVVVMKEKDIKVQDKYKSIYKEAEGERK